MNALDELQEQRRLAGYDARWIPLLDGGIPGAEVRRVPTVVCPHCGETVRDEVRVFVIEAEDDLRSDTIRARFARADRTGVYYLLLRSGYFTVRQIQETPDQWLLDREGFGPKSLRVVRDLLGTSFR